LWSITYHLPWKILNICANTQSQGVAGLSEISAQDYKKAIEALKLAKGAEGKGAKAA